MNRKSLHSIALSLTLLMGICFSFTLSSVASVTNSVDRSDWTMTDLELVSTVSDGQSSIPRIAIDSEDNLHIVWYDNTDYDGAGTDYDIFYRKYTSSSDTWSALTVLSDGTASSMEPDIEVDVFDNVHVVWYDYTDDDSQGDVDIYYCKYSEDSSSWGAEETLSILSTSSSFSPSITSDSTGNVYVAWDEWTDDDGEADSDIYYRKYRNATDDWASADVISSESTANSAISNIAVDDGGMLYATWYDHTDILGAGADSDIFFKKFYTEGLAIQSNTELISTESTSASYWGKIGLDGSGNVHVCWYDLTNLFDSDGNYDIFYKQYDVGLESWSAPVMVSESDVTASFPKMAVEEDGGVHIFYRVFGDVAGSGPDYDMLYRYYDVNSASWSGFSVVSKESFDNSYNGDLAIDSKGYVHFVMEDITDAGAGTDADIFHKKFVGAPAAPTLAPIAPQPDTDGLVTLSWTSEVGAFEYDVYRSTSYIFTIEGLIPIGSTNDTQFTDTVSVDGAYYYAVIAYGDYGISEPSNVEVVEVLITPEPEPAEQEFLNIPVDLLVIGGAIMGFQLILFVLGLLFKKK